MNTNLLNQSFTLPCGVTLKNRIAKSAMSENMASGDHNPNSKFETLYHKWAQGGAGLLITGNIMIDNSALGEPANVVFDHHSNLSILKKWSAAGRVNGTHIWTQINHPGKQSPRFLSKQPVAPSSIAFGPPLNKMFNPPRALSESEIENLIIKFGLAAKMSQDTGFSGVQIHGAHGYLVSQFLSPLHNQRKDKWGGSLENRMRFVLSIYKEMRKSVGVNFPIGIKLNSADFQKGGFTKEESMDVVEALSSQGVDLIEISGGSYESPQMMGIKKAASTIAREAYFLEYCEDIRKRSKAPLMLTGGFRTIEGMNQALQSGATDIIGLARTIVINPNFPNELLKGSSIKSEVRPLSTGIKTLDRLFPLEITWYTNQIHLLGKGQNPKPNLRPLTSIFNSILTLGLQGLKRVR